MAWKTKNNIPLEESVAFQRFIEYGYIPLEHYVNNMVKIACKDKDGYIVMIARASLGRVKEYQKFSVTSNPIYYIHNMNLYGQQHGFPSTVINWCHSTIKNHVTIKCKCECGEEFICDANNWKRGEKIRCNKCVNIMSNLEKTIQQFLYDNQIDFIFQKRFKECRDIKPLPFDFYLKDYNVCIEIDGEQHFSEHSKFFINCRMSFEDRQKKDRIKDNFCLNNNITLIRLKYDVIRNNKFQQILKEQLNIH